MGNEVMMSDLEHRNIDLLIAEFNARGGMSTEELMKRLDAIPCGEFQRGIKEKIQNYKVENK